MAATLPNGVASNSLIAFLLDAPCSATGVIRRHPDIKWLRRDRDIPELAQLQSEILDAIWPHLKSGGTLGLCHLFGVTGRE